MHTGLICGIDLGRNRAIPLGQRALPVGRGQLQASSLLVQIAEVIVDVELLQIDVSKTQDIGLLLSSYTAGAVPTMGAWPSRGG